MSLGTGTTAIPEHRPGRPDAGRAGGISFRSMVRSRTVVAVCGLLLAGGIAAGCGGGGGAAAPTTSPAHETATQATVPTTAPTTTTTSMPAQCGSPRDPLDPTNAPAPSPPAC